MNNAAAVAAPAFSKYVVHMDNINPAAVCEACQADLSSEADECDVCGLRTIARYVDLTVEGPGVAEWVALRGHYVDWELDGDDYATARVLATYELPEDLEDAGYRLDTTDYQEED